MVMEQRFTPSEHRHPAAVARRPRPHWGHLSRSVSRYGVVSSELVVYSPDAAERDRRWAELSRVFGTVVAGGALLAWIGFAAAGVPPLIALLAIAAVAIPAGIVLARSTRAVRHEAARVASCTSGLQPDTADREAQRRLDALADAMQQASEEYRSGAMDPERFLQVWRATYVHAQA